MHARKDKQRGSKKKSLLRAMKPGLFVHSAGLGLEAIKNSGIDGRIANIPLCPVHDDLGSRYGALSISLTDYMKITFFTNDNYLMIPNGKGAYINEDPRLLVFDWTCKNPEIIQRHEELFGDNILMLYRESTENAFLNNALRAARFSLVDTCSYEITRKDPTWVELFGNTITLDVKIYS